jgi:hypothetical protein
MLEQEDGMANGIISGLIELQNEFCLMKLSGEIRIVDKNQILKVKNGNVETEVAFYKKQDGILLMKRHLENLPIDSDVKKAIEQFFVNPNTHVYDKVAFSPLTLTSTTLNYWSGSGCNPEKGHWHELRDFILNVVCNNDMELFKYLIRYIAHMLQKPEDKSGVMIVMLGGQGTGKGTFFSMLRKIWAQTSLQINDVDQVLGTFNAALERNYVILMDEALFSGDKKSLEKLKSLITEPQCRIEQKYQPSRTIDSYHRFFAASNNEHFAKVDKDDRRFLFLRVSDRHKGDLIYFEILHKLIADGKQIRAMAHDLLAMDISKFNVRQRPKTKEHLNQKLQSLDGFDRYWYEILQLGTIGMDSEFKSSVKWETSIFISTKELINQYKGFNRNADRYTTVQTNTINSALDKLCPSVAKTRPSINGVQIRGLELPTIQIARREFEKYMGSKLEWDQDSVNEELVKEPKLTKHNTFNEA